MRATRANGSRQAAGVSVAFERGPERRYEAFMVRGDGVTIAFAGGSYTPIGGAVGEVPHDMAHLVIEGELGLVDGVWGTLADGGLFERSTRIVNGRQKPHAARRGRQLVVAARDSIIEAEVVVRVVCEASMDPEACRAEWVRRELSARSNPPGLSDPALTRAFKRMQEVAEAWARAQPGEQVRVIWPPETRAPRSTPALHPRRR